MASCCSGFMLPGSVSGHNISSSPINKPPSLSTPSLLFSWRLQRKQLAYTGLRRIDRHALQVFANANAPRGKGNKGDDIIMVDPLEAKRLAAMQMQEIQAREKRKRQRQIEAINGAWATIGLTAGLVVEGQTGNGILAQLAGYIEAIKNFFTQ